MSVVGPSRFAHVFNLEHVLMQSWVVLPCVSLTHNSVFLHIFTGCGKSISIENIEGSKEDSFSLRFTNLVSARDSLHLCVSACSPRPMLSLVVMKAVVIPHHLGPGDPCVLGCRWGLG